MDLAPQGISSASESLSASWEAPGAPGLAQLCEDWLLTAPGAMVSWFCDGPLGPVRAGLRLVPVAQVPLACWAPAAQSTPVSPQGVCRSCVGPPASPTTSAPPPASGGWTAPPTAALSSASPTSWIFRTLSKPVREWGAGSSPGPGGALEGLGLTVVPRGRTAPEAWGLWLWVECWTTPALLTPEVSGLSGA